MQKWIELGEAGIMNVLINETYLKGILDDVAQQSRPLSRDDFYALCRPDIRAGYGVEVEEAARRYFAGRKGVSAGSWIATLS
jgi:hypothetical protein